MAKKVGTLIREARTAADLTQEQLARKVKGVSASDISRAERGEMDLPQAALKEIAKATGVTQKSLLDAAAGTAKKTASKTTAKSAPKTTAKSSSKTSSGTSLKLTATEKKLVELYREADSDTKKRALKILKGEDDGLLSNLINGAAELFKGK